MEEKQNKYSTPGVAEAISKLDRLIEKKESALKQYREEYKQLRKEMYDLLPDKIYRIRCTPSDKYHTILYAGYFTTFKRAQEILDIYGNEYKKDSKLTWFYDVVLQDKTEDIDVKEINRIPDLIKNNWKK